MSIRIGYLLPTRERVMAGQPQAAPLLELAEQAERLGVDSVWAGDSLLARQHATNSTPTWPRRPSSRTRFCREDDAGKVIEPIGTTDQAASLARM